MSKPLSPVAELRPGHRQNTQSEHSAQRYLPTETHLQLPDEKRRQAEDGDIEDDIGHATADIHNRVVGRRHAHDPVAPQGPNLEEGSEEEGDQPGDDDDNHNLDGNREAGDGEQSPVKAQHRELDQSDGDDVPELEDEQDLKLLLKHNDVR